MIQRMGLNHLSDVCRIHMEALPQSFLPMLGKHFLSVVYGTILECDLGFGFVYILDDEVAGFVLATQNSDKLFEKVIRKKWMILLKSVSINIMKKPLIIFKLAETALYPGKTSDISAELLVIAVDEKYRGKKVGKSLIKNLDVEFADEMIYKYKVSVYSDNNKANNFYRSTGFEFDYFFSLYGKKCNVYNHIISQIKSKNKEVYS